MPGKQKITARQIAAMGVMAAVLTVAKLALSFLPNIEPVSLLLILCALTIGYRSLYVVSAFILIEGLLYGFGIWWIFYLYVWPLLVILTIRFRKQDSVLFWAIFSGIYGLLFGLLYAISFLFSGGPYMVFVKWISGIPFDIIHGISNFIICLVLMKPLRRVMKRL